MERGPPSKLPEHEFGTENGEQAEDDDQPMLSAHALQALKEFLTEQNQLSAAADEDGGTTTESGSDTTVSLVKEDWRMSQFWYDPETAQTVAAEVADLCKSDDFRVACVACPTLYAYLKKLYPNASVQLLEYDMRFEQYGSDFTFYDYNQPKDLPDALQHSYKIVVADPPYLSQECLEKVAQTISFLAHPTESYVLLLTDINF
uniref:Protein-lysine N-methyltransferase n=1 Tax=Kalanchoe fedtschenkoi TaxID=63787 RepID=A0A7N1A9S4_KALFE